MTTNKGFDLDSMMKAVQDYNQELQEKNNVEQGWGIEIISNIEKWSELKDFLSKLPYTYYYRGQSDARWFLETKIDRYFSKTRRIFNIGNRVSKRDFESHLIAEFNRNSTLLNISENLINSYTQKLSFLQHYGAPTRLLDVTSSPYVALFFALIDCIPIAPVGEMYCALYVIDNEKIYIQNKSLVQGICKLYFPDRLNEILEKFHNYRFNDEELFDLFFLKPYPTEQANILDNIKFLGFISPIFYFNRLLQQSGAFLCSGNINESLMENYLSGFQITKKPVIKKLIISSKMRDEALIDLEKMNITYSTLFGDTEAQVKSMALKTELHFKKHHKWFIQKFT